jgi:hypothetical protein
MEIGRTGEEERSRDCSGMCANMGCGTGDSVGRDGSVRHGSSRGSERINPDDRDSISKQGLPAQIQRKQTFRKSYDNRYSLKATADQVASRSRHYQAYNSARQLSTTVIAVQHFDTATTFEGHQLDRFHKRNAGLVCWRQYVSIGKRHRLRDLQLKHQHVARLGRDLRNRHEAQQVSLLTKPGSWLSQGQLVANQLHEPLRITNLRTSEPGPSDLETPDTHLCARTHTSLSTPSVLSFVDESSPSRRFTLPPRPYSAELQLIISPFRSCSIRVVSGLRPSRRLPGL